jgi:hypothetical protein
LIHGVLGGATQGVLGGATCGLKCLGRPGLGPKFGGLFGGFIMFNMD